MWMVKVPEKSDFPVSMPVFLFKPDIAEKTKRQEEAETEETPYDGRQLLCRQCLAAITRPEERIAVDGAHQHTFANPHGIVFEIDCFRNAWGCGAIGSPTDEFTWFSGYFWQVAICATCMTHVGWRFTSVHASPFYGLIHDRLVESE